MMRAKKRVTCFLAMLFACVFMFSSSAIVSAAGNITSKAYWDDLATQIELQEGGVASAEDLVVKLSRVAGDTKYNDAGTDYFVIVVSESASASTFYVNGKAEMVDIQKYTPITLSNFTDSSGNPIIGIMVYYYTTVNSAALNNVYNKITTSLLSQAGVAPDTGTAMKLLSGVMPMVNTLLGLIVIVISVGMTVFSALDIIYLAFPAFRGKIDTQVEGGGRGTKQNKDGSISSIWVTDDARLAMQEAQQNQSQPWGRYIKRRILAYAFLAIILFILLTGNIFSITTLITDALQGLFNALGIG